MLILTGLSFPLALGYFLPCSVILMLLYLAPRGPVPEPGWLFTAGLPPCPCTGNACVQPPSRVAASLRMGPREGVGNVNWYSHYGKDPRNESRTQPCWLLVLDFQPPGLQEIKLFFKPCSLWYFATAAWADWTQYGGSLKPKNRIAHHQSVQFSRSVVSNSFRPHEPQHARPPCSSPTPGVYSNSCPSSWWCHPAISSSVVPFSSCPQSLPAPGSFPRSQLFAWGGQSIGVSASASVLPMNTQDWSPLERTGWISLQSKGLSRVFPNTTVQKHQFFSTQLSLQSNSHIHTWPLEKP